MRLILFDIDGTLLRTHGAGKTAITRALSPLTDASISTAGVAFSGRTDPAIFEDVLAKNGLPTTKSFIDQAIERYVTTMQDTLTSNDVEVLPGVRTLLAELDSRSDVYLGLVTGNVKAVAYGKLACAGLHEYFPFGSFGSDHTDRDELPLIAARRASSFAGHTFRLDEQAVIIGDTVHDIRCGKAVGANVVSVCTGRYERETLTRHAPDLVLDTLRSSDAFIEYLLNS